MAKKSVSERLSAYSAAERSGSSSSGGAMDDVAMELVRQNMDQRLNEFDGESKRVLAQMAQYRQEIDSKIKTLSNLVERQEAAAKAMHEENERFQQQLNTGRSAMVELGNATVERVRNASRGTEEPRKLTPEEARLENRRRRAKNLEIGREAFFQSCGAGFPGSASGYNELVFYMDPNDDSLPVDVRKDSVEFHRWVATGEMERWCDEHGVNVREAYYSQMDVDRVRNEYNEFGI